MIAAWIGTFKDVAAGFQSVVAIAAVIVGGVWAYYRFVRSRTYRPRVDLTINADRIAIEGSDVVLCRIAADNVGDTVVSLKQRGTGLSVETARITDEAEFTWEKGPVYSIFESHDRIEPAEVIRDELGFAVNSPCNLIRLQARIIWEVPGGRRIQEKSVCLLAPQEIVHQRGKGGVE